MPFDVGDKVVYPHHGAATIEKREKKDVFGKKQDYLVLRLAYGDLTLMVPADNAEEIGLRDVINDEEVEEVFAVLRKKEARMPTNWSRRFKNHVEKLKSGDIYQVAEVVRNLTIREKDKGLSAGEKRMLGKARQILVSELTFALKVDEETAEAKLDEVLGKGDAGVTRSIDDESMPKRPPPKAAGGEGGGQGPGQEGPGQGGREGPGEGGQGHEDRGEGTGHKAQVAPAKATVKPGGQAGPSSRRSRVGSGGRSVFVEVTRLFTVVLLTAAGFMLGKDLAPAAPSSPASAGCSAASSATSAAGSSVASLERAVGVVERRVDRVPPPQVLAGHGRRRLRRGVRPDVAVPLALLVRPRAIAIGSVGSSCGSRCTSASASRRAQSEELFAMAGLSTRPLVRAAPYDDSDGFLVDSSAVMDGQLLPLSRSGLFRDDLLVPALRPRRAAGLGRRERRALAPRAARARDPRGAAQAKRRTASSCSTTRCPRSTRSTPSSSRSRAGCRCACSRTTSTWPRSPSCRACRRSSCAGSPPI